MKNRTKRVVFRDQIYELARVTTSFLMRKGYVAPLVQTENGTPSFFCFWKYKLIDLFSDRSYAANITNVRRNGLKDSETRVRIKIIWNRL